MSRHDDRERAAPRAPDHAADATTAPPDLRIDRAMRVFRSASTHGVRLSARMWARHPGHEWHGAPVAHARALVVVGGFATDTVFYGLLRRSYEAAGIRRVAVMPPVDNAFGDIRASAERLAALVRLLGGEVDVVGHSEGGLVARWFVQQLGGDEVVRHVVTIGTPNRGLPSRLEDYPRLERFAAARRVHKVADVIAHRTVLPMASVAVRQMLRGSEFMQTLGEGPPELPTQFLAMRSRWDGVVPWRSADMPPGTNVANVDLGGGPRLGNHAAIASTSPQAFETTMTFVRRP